MKASIQSLALFATLFLESTEASCAHGTSMMKRQVHMKRDLNGGLQKRVEVGKFAYLGETGPTNWDKLAPENSACRTSKVQSPIDITGQSSTLVEAGKLKMNFPEVEGAEFENLGTTIEVVMKGKNASTTVDGKEFPLAQFHFHTPGEHTINGEYMPLEMHMVHEAADGSIAVVAVPFQLSETGESNDLLKELLPSMEAIRAPGSVVETGPLKFESLVKALEAQPLRTYSGSLTTPPCAEGLQFFVATEAQPLDVKTFNTMKSIIGFNARFVQNAAGNDNLLGLTAVSAAGKAATNGTAPAKEAVRVAAPKLEVVKGEAPKAGAANGEAAKGEAAKGEAAKGEAAKGEAAKDAAPKAEAGKAEGAKGEAAKAAAPVHAAPAAAAPKAEAAKGEAAKGEAAKAAAPVHAAAPAGEAAKAKTLTFVTAEGVTIPMGVHA